VSDAVIKGMKWNIMQRSMRDDDQALSLNRLFDRRQNQGVKLTQDFPGPATKVPKMRFHKLRPVIEFLYLKSESGKQTLDFGPGGDMARDLDAISGGDEG